MVRPSVFNLAYFLVFLGAFIGLTQFMWNAQMGKSSLVRAIVSNGSITVKGMYNIRIISYVLNDFQFSRNLNLQDFPSTMDFLCELLTDNPFGGLNSIPFWMFKICYTFLASFDCNLNDGKGNNFE